MGKPTGFLEYERKDGPVTVPKERIKNFKEFHGQLPEEEQRLHGMRRSLLPGGYNDCRNGFGMPAA